MGSLILKSPLPYLALVIAHIIWGANFVVAKITLQEFPVMTLAFLRFFLATILMLPFLITFDKKEFKVPLTHLPKLFLAGIMLVTINIALFYEGIKHTTAINASVLSMSIPIISVLGGWIILKEKIFWVNLAGILFGLLGAITVLGLPLIFVNGLSSEELLGNLLILLSCVSFVGGAILSKQLLKTYHPIIFTFYMFLIGAITFLIPAALEFINIPDWPNHISILGFLGLLYIIILSSITAFFMQAYGIDRTDVIKANLFHYIEPAVAATFAVPLLGERISFSFIIGTCLVVLGVYWGTLGKLHHHHQLHKHHRN